MLNCLPVFLFDLIICHYHLPAYRVRRSYHLVMNDVPFICYLLYIFLVSPAIYLLNLSFSSLSAPCVSFSSFIPA